MAQSRTVLNITIGTDTQPGFLYVDNGQITIVLADGTKLIENGVLQGLQGNKTYYVATSSAGSPVIPLTFKNGLLIKDS